MMKSYSKALAAIPAILGIVGPLLAAGGAHAAELCTTLSDAATGQVLVQRGDCQTRVTPASTFKIAISLMGYDAGFLQDEHAPALPFRPGDVDWRDNWKHPADPARWMADSVVWYSQQVTQALGKPRFGQYVQRFGYGNMDVAGNAQHDGLILSWIGSSLKISPLEQTAFLRRMLKRELGVSSHAYAMTARLTRYDQHPAQWNVHGKTGAASGFGWYVGWAEKEGRTVVFARLIRKDAVDPEDVPAGVLARDGLIRDWPGLLAAPAAH